MGGKGGGNFAWQKLKRKFSNFILAAAEMSKFDGSFLGRKNTHTHTPYMTKEALSVHGTC